MTKYDLIYKERFKNESCSDNTYVKVIRYDCMRNALHIHYFQKLLKVNRK